MPTRTARLALASALALTLSGCSAIIPGPEDTPRLPTMRRAVEASALRFSDDAGAPGVTRVRVPPSSLKVGTILSPISPSLRSRRIEILLPDTAKLTDVMGAVQTMTGIGIAYKWKNGTDSAILDKKPPFTHYEGTFGGMMDALRRGAGVVSWQEGETVYISDADRFSITLPPVEDIISSTSESLTSLGATDVVSSLDGGTIVYSAAPDLQVEVIDPFVKRLMRNLSTIHLQVAIVSLAVNDKMKQGFDWNAFSVALKDPTTAAANAVADAAGTGTGSTGVNPITGGATGTTNTGVKTGTTTSTGTNNSTGATGVGGTAGSSATVEDMAKALSTGIALSHTSTGEVFGKAVVTTVAGAIDFLSNFGNATVTQHVDLRTLSGKAVKFHTGQEIPYVKEIAATTTEGTSGTTGSTQTETLSTGLTVDMTPRYDSDSQIVTVEFDLDLTSLIEFVKLNAGNQLGELTQPRTQEQTLNDIVRLRAGQTAVLGGLQYDQDTYSGNEPSFLRGALKRNNLSIGSRATDVQRNALFVILRPVVTVYETDDSFADFAGGMSK